MTAKQDPPPTPKKQPTPINVCRDCGAHSTGGHICRGRQVRRR
ncbi:hypothetical protein [Microbispora sp. ATCC PTA-5024]|nr:hypothetical protein [Microbispora sp. ATCC PTA-5024]